MKKFTIFTFTILVSFVFVSAQQRNCGTMEYLETLKAQVPFLEEKIRKDEIKFQKRIKNNSNAKSTVLTIPVVVHVVYNNTTENISTAQVQSQMDILNADFRRLNADASNTPAGFQSVGRF